MYKYILKNYKRKINILLLFKVFLRIKDYFFQNNFFFKNKLYKQLVSFFLSKGLLHLE